MKAIKIKKIIKICSLFLAVIFLTFALKNSNNFGGLKKQPALALRARPIASNNKAKGEKGYLYLDKKATTTSLKDVWKIELLVGGPNPPPVYVDIMSVIDTSDSMNYFPPDSGVPTGATEINVGAEDYRAGGVFVSTSRIFIAKEAAKTLVNTMWNDTNPVAIENKNRLYRIGLGAYRFLVNNITWTGNSRIQEFYDLIGPDPLLPAGASRWSTSYANINPISAQSAQARLSPFYDVRNLSINGINAAYNIEARSGGVSGVNPHTNKNILLHNVSLLYAQGNSTPTHIALSEAAKILRSATDPRTPQEISEGSLWNKAIILITDGKPYYNIATSANNVQNDFVAPPRTLFDGSTYNAAQYATETALTLSAPSSNAISPAIENFVDQDGSAVFTPGRSLSTATIARIIKERSDIKIYTVGMSLGVAEEKLMKYVATDDSDTTKYAFNSAATGHTLNAQLQAHFKKIAEGLKVDSGGSASVYDHIANEFDLYVWEGESATAKYGYWTREDATQVPPVVDQIQIVGKEIVWKIKKFAPIAEPDTLTYYVKLKPEISAKVNGEIYATNEYAYIEYINIDNVPAIKFFPHPFVAPQTVNPTATPNEFDNTENFEDSINYSPSLPFEGWKTSKNQSSQSKSGATTNKPQTITKEQQQAQAQGKTLEQIADEKKEKQAQKKADQAVKPAVITNEQARKEAQTKKQEKANQTQKPTSSPTLKPTPSPTPKL